MTCDILNFEFSTRGIRDIGIVEPVLSYLEIKYHLKIVRKCIMDNYVRAIAHYNPKVIVISNTIGTIDHFEMTKYATMKGIKVISFISEGDMVDIKENVEILFWGNNTDRFMYEYANLQWSKKNVDLIHRYISGSEKFNLRCVGGTGFDRYKFMPMKSKQAFIDQYKPGSGYTKVVGIGGFPFYFFLSDMYRKDGQWVNMHLDPEACDIMGKQKDPLREMYRTLISNNPDILFVLKFHPAELKREYSEFHGLDSLSNVVFIHKEEKIEDVINVSDLWLAFESTTCMEAWLIGKVTLIANPNKVEFVRSVISSGSPHYGNVDELNNAVKTFFSTGSVPEFDILDNQRSEIIRNVMAHGDGLNHVRAGDYIYSILNEPAKNVPVDSVFIKYVEDKQAKRAIRRKLRYALYKTPFRWLPKISKEFEKDKAKEMEYSVQKRQELAEMYKAALTIFYKKQKY